MILLVDHEPPRLRRVVAGSIPLRISNNEIRGLDNFRLDQIENVRPFIDELLM